MADKRIVVFGAGAIGGYTGGNLAHNGFDVTLIDPWPEHIEAIRKDGLALEGVSEAEFVRARPKTMHLTEAQNLSREKPIDICFISMKSYDTEWATTMMRQYLAPGGYCVSLQNCINEERIAGIVGWGKTVGAIAALLSAELYAPGKIRRTGAKNPPGHEVYRVGEVHGRVTARIEELGAMIRTVDSCRVTDNLWGERWSKLCVNGMHNGVSAASGLSGNAMRQDDRIRQVIIKLGGESVRIGQALGYKLEDIAGQDAEKLARASEGDRAALDEVESLMLALRNSQGRSEAQRPSMGQDMMKGRRTEIDFINGVIVERGAAIGGSGATHAKLIAAVKQANWARRRQVRSCSMRSTKEPARAPEPGGAGAVPQPELIVSVESQRAGHRDRYAERSPPARCRRARSRRRRESPSRMPISARAAACTTPTRQRSATTWHANCVNQAVEAYALPGARYPDLVRFEQVRAWPSARIDQRRSGA